jgi:hypothetical protein
MQRNARMKNVLMTLIQQGQWSVPASHSRNEQNI